MYIIRVAHIRFSIFSRRALVGVVLLIWKDE